MDIVLQGEMDGIEAAEKIHSEYDIPIIYLTAYADEKTLQRAKITEPFGYLLKPFEEKKLRSTIEIALYKHKMARQVKQNKEFLSGVLKGVVDTIISKDKQVTVKDF